MLAPLTIDALQETFFREECPYWWAYSAKNTKQKVGQFRKDEQEDELLQDSWMQLEYLIGQYDYGHLLIKCKKNPNDREESTQHWYVKWGEDLMPQRSFAGRRSAAGMGSSSHPMNMNMGMWPMMQFLMNQQAQTHQIQLENARENMRLNFENQQLQDRIEGTEEPSMQEYMLKETFEAVKLWLGPKLNPAQFQPTQPMGALGTIGQRDEATSQAPVPTTEGSKRTSFDAIMNDINAVYHSLGKQYEPNEITRALAIFCQQNPGPADQFIGPMIQKLREHAKSQGQHTD